MPTLLPPVTQCPDDLMEIDIADLIFRLDLRVHRSARWLRLLHASGPSDFRQLVLDGAEREKALLHAATVAVRVRCREVASFARSLGMSYQSEEARRCPWVVACGIVVWVMRDCHRDGSRERHS